MMLRLFALLLLMAVSKEKLVRYFDKIQYVKCVRTGA